MYIVHALNVHDTVLYNIHVPCVLFSQPSSAVGETGQSPEPSEFVSAVTWRNSSNVLLAANSQGHIKVSCHTRGYVLNSTIVFVHNYRYWRCAEVLLTLWTMYMLLCCMHENSHIMYMCL